MTRSLWKGPFVDANMFTGLDKTNKRIWSRRSVIVPQFVNKTVSMHNGKRFISLLSHIFTLYLFLSSLLNIFLR